MIVTVGSEEAVYLALAATVDVGDEILIPEPGYPAYWGIATMLGAKPVAYPLERSRLRSWNRVRFSSPAVKRHLDPWQMVEVADCDHSLHVILVEPSARVAHRRPGVETLAVDDDRGLGDSARDRHRPHGIGFVHVSRTGTSREEELRNEPLVVQLDRRPSSIVERERGLSVRFDFTAEHERRFARSTVVCFSEANHLRQGEEQREAHEEAEG